MMVLIKLWSARCGLTAILVMLAFIGGFGMSDLTARSDVYRSGQTVNRTLKGDRLPLALALHPNAVNQSREAYPTGETTSDSKLPEGCEALISPIASPQLARIAGRCVS